MPLLDSMTRRRNPGDLSLDLASPSKRCYTTARSPELTPITGSSTSTYSPVSTALPTPFDSHEFFALDLKLTQDRGSYIFSIESPYMTQTQPKTRNATSHWVNSATVRTRLPGDESPTLGDFDEHSLSMYSSEESASPAASQPSTPRRQTSFSDSASSPDTPDLDYSGVLRDHSERLSLRKSITDISSFPDSPTLAASPDMLSQLGVISIGLAEPTASQRLPMDRSPTKPKPSPIRSSPVHPRSGSIATSSPTVSLVTIHEDQVPDFAGSKPPGSPSGTANAISPLRNSLQESVRSKLDSWMLDHDEDDDEEEGEDDDGERPFSLTELLSQIVDLPPVANNTPISISPAPIQSRSLPLTPIAPSPIRAHASSLLPALDVSEPSSSSSRTPLQSTTTTKPLAPKPLTPKSLVPKPLAPRARPPSTVTAMPFSFGTPLNANSRADLQRHTPQASLQAQIQAQPRSHATFRPPHHYRTTSEDIKNRIYQMI